MTDIDLDAIEARANAVYAAVHLSEMEERALTLLDSGVVDDLVAEVRRLREELDEGFAAIALAGAEIERASVEVDRAHRALLASNAERDDARAAIARVRALHSADDEYEEPTCHHCRCKTCGARHIPHPCPTIRALDGGDA